MLSRTLLVVPLFVSFFLVGCGKNEEKAPWPGKLASLNGFSDTESTQVISAIDALNTQAGKTVVSLNNTESNFPITIYKVSAATWPQSRAGFATVRTTDCKVELSDALFTNQKKDYLEPVVWHEIGHCGGLPHTNGEGEIMSPVTEVMSAYPSTIVNKFISSITSSIGL